MMNHDVREMGVVVLCKNWGDKWINKPGRWREGAEDK